MNNDELSTEDEIKAIAISLINIIDHGVSKGIFEGKDLFALGSIRNTAIKYANAEPKENQELLVEN